MTKDRIKKYFILRIDEYDTYTFGVFEELKDAKKEFNELIGDNALQTGKWVLCKIIRETDFE